METKESLIEIARGLKLNNIFENANISQKEILLAILMKKKAYIFFIVLSADVHFNRKPSITEIKRLRRQKRP